MEKERFKARDVPPTALRLHPDVRAELVRIAFVNGRSLSKEISVRIEASLKADAAPAPPPPPPRPPRDRGPPPPPRPPPGNHQRPGQPPLGHRPGRAGSVQAPAA